MGFFGGWGLDWGGMNELGSTGVWDGYMAGFGCWFWLSGASGGRYVWRVGEMDGGCWLVKGL